MNFNEILMVLFILFLHQTTLGKTLESTTTDPVQLQNETEHNITRNSTTELIPPIARFQTRVSLPTHVAFMASLSHNIKDPSVGHTVFFDQENLDTSNSYNPNIGIFSVPISGVYYISLTASSQGERSYHALHLSLKKEGVNVGDLPFDSSNGDWKRRNEVVILHLNAGESMYVQVTVVIHPCTINGGNFSTHFQGFLIFPD